MRHLGTLIAAIVIGPLAWILVAFGQDRSATAFAKAQSTGAFHTGDFVQPLIFLGAAGILLGLIGTLRFSPLGAALTGVVYVASYVALLIDPKGMLNLFKHNLDIAGRHADPTLPIQTGTTLVLGALLLVAVASLGRWRRWPRPVTDEPDGPPARDVAPFVSTPERLLSTTTSARAGESTESTTDLAAGPSSGTSLDVGDGGWTSTLPTAGEAPHSSAGSPWSTPLREEEPPR
jgi:hypothetical protein